MKTTTLTCDIEDMTHSGTVSEEILYVIFDHDQEDGRTKTKPYLDKKGLCMCEGCYQYMLKERRYIYAYGAMGYNKYYLKDSE